MTKHKHAHVPAPVDRSHKIKLAAAAILISSHYIKMVELAELTFFVKDALRFIAKILGMKGGISA